MVSELFILRQYLDFDAALRGACRDYKECKHEVEWARLIAAAEVETDPPIDPAEIARTAERAHEIAKQARALRQRRDDPLELLPVYNASVHLIETIVRALDHTDVYLENATRDPLPAIQRWLDHINVPDWLAAEGRARDYDEPHERDQHLHGSERRASAPS